MIDNNDESWNLKLARISDYYSKLVQEHGKDFKSCDYGHWDSQQKKFAAIADVMSLRGKRILDVGCGLGDFADFLIKRYGDISYTGLEITPAMIDKARYYRPQLDIRQVDILNETLEDDFDLVTANGIFYLLGPNAKKITEKIIARMFDITKQAVAFTTLSTWADYQEPDEFYADPLETLAYCRSLTPWVTLRHDYVSHDFTVYMYKYSPFGDINDI